LRTTGEADLFGWAVAGAGDVDGDGVPDVLVGEPGSAPVPGEARLFSGLTGALLQELNGGSRDSWDGFGFAVAGAGDLDGDGRADYLVGQPSLSGEEPGAVKVYRGSDGGLLYTLTGLGAGDGFGAALASVGQIDGDSAPDFAVGTLGGAYARVHSGATGALLHHFIGPGPGYGASVSGIGDMDGDGTDDVAVGAPTFNNVDVMSGATGLLLRRFETPAGSFGASIAALGDVDDDGAPDLLIGAPDDTLLDAEGCGSALVVSGQTGGQLFKFFGDEPGEHAGAAVAGLADADGDGLPELLLGTPGDVVPAAGGVGSAKAYPGALAGSIEPYGFGCPNSFLITPVIELLGDPTPGGAVILSLTRLVPASAAIVVIGGGPGSQPLSNGCILWVASPLPTTLFFPLGEFPRSADAVTASGRLPAAVPPGAVVSLQCFVIDPFADGGFASSNAVQLTVQ
ncbi:MAG TPA: VCBS repeat-containing protein, partial [Planctomycetota bacterium]|nr:VCBS repeat-containing protein [Planctomycetota bacterium]